jgi:putative redox protein
MAGMDSRGRNIVIGSLLSGETEWLGVKASDLLLLAAASCSAYDVVTIMEKQREPMDGLDVTCYGEQNVEPPYAFTKIHLHYKARGDVNPEKLQRAIQLSEQKYCSVIATLKPTVEITSDYEINPTNG